MLFAQKIIVLGFIVLLSACSITPAKNQNLNGDYSDHSAFVLKKGNAPISFELPTADGQVVKLDEVTSEQNVLLVFYRGDWCPYCIDQFSTIQPVLPQLKEYNVKLIAISPDEKNAAQNTQRKFGQDYTFLMDTNLNVSKQYGVSAESGLPHPAVFLIRGGENKRAEIAWFYVSTDHTTRPTGEQLLAQVKTLISKP